MSSLPKPARHCVVSKTGFTLVELLVVIGIIALLISILLPALSKAREQGNTIKCLSNLRQLAVAAAAYTTQNKGFLISADIQDTRRAVSLPYQDTAETWATILVGDKFVDYPELSNSTLPYSGDSVFRCPSGVLELSVVVFNDTTLPSTRTDAQGAMATRHTSNHLRPGKDVFVWYGINSSNQNGDGAANLGYDLPYVRTTINSKGVAAWEPSGGAYKKGYRQSTQIRKPTEMVFLFDGLYGFNYITAPNRINARHNGQKVTNIGFVDGHAESLGTKDLPGGIGDARLVAGRFDMAQLKKFPFPLWRMEQQARF